ncbi:MAG: 16S rRNA (cytidine(1402)-2'-O)-methyltransferase [Firmicutes bacterium]|nr:16S rRNA (cytidine(1402)-2'-O)-methyltransferase [Bacillota bacterium]
MLYIVATPIGNLLEMNERAIQTLKDVDLIACEDTRHSGKLLKHFDIKTKMVAYQKFNEKASTKGLIDLLLGDKNIALISDAGMPLISDPGSILIQECIANDIDYTVISGACALINAVVLSGFDTVEFSFLGFLPDKKSLRENKLKPYLFVPSTLIFYSPPQNVIKDCEFLFSIFGARRAAVIREISKMYESIYRGNLGEDLKIKEAGEFVIVVEGYKGVDKDSMSEVDLYNEYINMGLTKMDAIKAVAKDKGVPKSVIYDLIN